VLLKIDADQARIHVEMEAVAMAPDPTPEVGRDGTEEGLPMVSESPAASIVRVNDAVVGQGVMRRGRPGGRERRRDDGHG
jgi:hypothetical protein